MYDETMRSPLLTLAFESSCDETAVAVLEGERIVRSSVVSTQAELHAKYGGVVPEVACRRHAEVIRPATCEALREAGVTLDDIGLIAATAGPGLVGALLVGLSYAKGIAWGRRLPLVPVNHLEGHMAAALLAEPDLPTPALFLLVSGGHTELYLMRSFGDLTRLGGTRDDAAGEAFDKVARMVGLGYPGGPLVEKRAREGNPRYPVPVALANSDYEFSFSGPKTVIRQLVDKGEGSVEDLCASFQQGVVAALVKKTGVAIERNGPKSLALVGGVAANGAVREGIARLAAEKGLPVAIPPLSLCGDNAAMIAAAGVRRYLLAPDDPRWFAFDRIDADPSWAP